MKLIFCFCICICMCLGIVAYLHLCLAKKMAKKTKLVGQLVADLALKWPKKIQNNDMD